MYVRGVAGADVTHWLKKVQFKLHETYAQSTRTVEAPHAFEVTETGWGEFEVAVRLFFAQEAAEKPASVYHQLRLHPWGADKEAAKARGDAVRSQSYDEVVFNEPSEAFYEVLTHAGPPPTGRGKGGGAGKGGAKGVRKGAQLPERSAEIPSNETPGNPYSTRTEGKELDRLAEAAKQVEVLIQEERERLGTQEAELEELRKTEGSLFKPK